MKQAWDFFWYILNVIKELANNCEVSFHHVHRDANMEVDGLAKLGIHAQESCIANSLPSSWFVVFSVA